MNQGRIWCVVNPTVGLPLFLLAVAAIAFIVHFAVLGNVDWIGAYWGASAEVAQAAPAAAAAPAQ